jgi:Tfp pilus assembly protein PilX
MMHRVRSRSEQGAALVLAIGVMVVIGMIATTSLALITTSLHARANLDPIRDRQYAADGAVESAIATVRTVADPGPGLASCGGPYTYPAVNGVAIRVVCANAPTLTTTGYLQRNVIFTACVDTGAVCTDSTAIVRAQVNYEAASITAPTITRTYVQSWSVNR